MSRYDDFDDFALYESRMIEEEQRRAAQDYQNHIDWQNDNDEWLYDEKYQRALYEERIEEKRRRRQAYRLRGDDMTERNAGISCLFEATTVLGIVFIVLKVIGYIDWGWGWVLAPFWIPVAIAGVYILITLLIAAIRGDFRK